MKLAVLYARVSTERQSDEGTIESQLGELRENSSKDKIIHEYIDEGWSGTTLARPALDDLRDDAKQGKFEAVYILDPDRLSRNHAHLMIVMAELKKLGIDIKFAHRDYKDNPEDKLVFNLQGVVAEYEREKILERTRRGKLQKAKRGHIVSSKAPYGYDFIRKSESTETQYKINVEEKRLVELIFDLFLQVRSIRGVATELHGLGIRPRSGKEYWAKSTITKILKNTTYIGTAYYNKHYSCETNNGKKYKKVIKTNKKLRNFEEWIPIKVSPIIDTSKFNQVQELLKHNQTKIRPAKNKYLLTGLIECGDCGSSYVGDPGKGRPCYRCTYRQRKNTIKEKCNNKQIRAEQADTLVWNTMVNLFDNPSIIVDQFKKYSSQSKTNKEKIQEKIDEMDKILKQKEEGRERIIHAYTNKKIRESDFDSALKRLDKEILPLQEEKEKQELKLEAIKEEPKKIQNINDFCNEVASRINNLSFNQKKDILRLVCEKVEYQPDSLEIHTVIPKNDGSKDLLLGHCDHQPRKSLKRVWLFPGRGPGPCPDREIRLLFLDQPF